MKLLDFGDEFIKLHEDSSFDNDKIDTELVDEDEDMKAFKNSSKKKGKGKKKKKKHFNDKLDLIMADIEVEEDDSGSRFQSLGLDDDDDYLFMKKGRKGKKHDLFDIKEAKKKKKKNIEAKFTPQITMLNKILKDTEGAATDIRKTIDQILQSKSRYAGKNLVDLWSALNTANSNRASIVRDISNIKKAIVDLNLKVEKANPKKDDKNVDNEEFGIDLFRRMLSGSSRKEMTDAARDFYRTDNSPEVYEDGNYEEEDVDDVIQRRLNSEENNRRSSEGNAYIKYEHFKPKDVIIYHQNGEWEIDAIDENGNSMPDDYPRLNESDVGNLRFELDQNLALDPYGRTYQVIQD